MNAAEVDERIARLHAPGLVDLHFDLPMDLYEKRDRADVLATEFLPELTAGDMGVVATALYIEDRYMPEKALAVGLGQVARLHEESERSGRTVVCKTHADIVAARAAKKIAFIISMEGVEPIGRDIDLLRIFYEVGVRVIGLTHARPNAAGSGGIFAASGSRPEGLTPFGREVVQACESLGLIVDLAHINPAGFDDILSLTTRPVIVSHTNARRYYDIERNVSDEQIKAVGRRHGVIGINSVLVSPKKEEATLDRYVDHIQHVIDLIGIESVGIGFDFFEFIYRQWPEEAQRELATKFTEPHFLPDLFNHSHARNLTRKLIERGFSDGDIEKILYQNWMRIFRELL